MNIFKKIFKKGDNMKLIVDVLERGEKKVTGEEALKIIPKGVV